MTRIYYIRKLTQINRNLLLLNVAFVIIGSVFIVDIWDIELFPFVHLIIINDYISMLFGSLALFRISTVLTEHFSPQNKSRLNFLYLLLTLCMVFGIGAHSSANNISLAMGTPSSIVYYWDEILGHLLVGLPMLAMFFSFPILSLFDKNSRYIDPYNNKVSMILGLLNGAFTAFMMLEAHLAVIALVAFTVVTLSILITNREKLVNNELLIYFYSMTIAFFAGIGLWYLYFGELAEPSAAKFLRY